MTAPRARTGSNIAARDAAVWWALQGDQARMSPDLRSAQEAWLAEGPERREAYAQAVAALDAVNTHAGEPEILALRKSALAARRDFAEPSWRRVAAGVAIVVTVGVTAALGWSLRAGQGRYAAAIDEEAAASASPSPGRIYRTAVGERSTFSLPDGSVATLDTASVLQVDYTAQERAVHLLKGQAIFEVAKHKPTPFQVYAADRRITAIGTVFDVRLDEGRMSVALIEGRIRVAQVASGARPGQTLGVGIVMAPGEVLDTGDGQPMRVKAADLKRVDSWRDGVVVFNDQRLEDAVRELNRYNVRPILLKQGRLRDLRVTGVFKTGEPERFAQTMTEIFPVDVDYDEGGAPTLRLRAAY